MLIEVYSDGSATIASKPGGYGWVICIDGKKHSEGNGHLRRATNNDAEMEGAIQGMAQAVRLMMNFDNDLRNQAEVRLCSDSQIVLHWAEGITRFKQAAKIHKYDQLRGLFVRLKAKGKWIRGHSGHEHNERCDVLAGLGRHNLGPDDELPKKRGKRLKKIGQRRENVICVNYKNSLKLVDFENNIVEDFNHNVHGDRTPAIEVP